MGKKVKSICPVCQRSFSYYPSAYKSGEKIHCSRECQKNASRITTICPCCGKEFWYHKSWPRKYCSSKCSATANISRQLGEHAVGSGPRVKLACNYCGKSFTKNYFEYKKTGHHFCSQSCFGKWNSENKRGENHPSYKKVERTCEYCGETFLASPNEIERGWAKFCNNECKAKWQSENYDPAKNPLPVMYGPDNPKWRGGYLPYYGPDWRPYRRAARKRDKYTCQHCGITEEELGRELDVHHIVPFREFGVDNHDQANELSNLISLCYLCHMKVEK